MFYETTNQRANNSPHTKAQRGNSPRVGALQPSGLNPPRKRWQHQSNNEAQRTRAHFTSRIPGGAQTPLLRFLGLGANGRAARKAVRGDEPHDELFQHELASEQRLHSASEAGQSQL